MTQPTTPAGSTPLAVAHRGDPYRHRENTLAAISGALAAGADAVEVDVQLTRDRVPVLLHDQTLKRLWQLDRPIGALTSTQLAAQKFAGGLRVPTLTEALKLFAEAGQTEGARPGVRLLIDLDEPGPARAAWEAVTALGAEELVAFCGPAPAMFAVREVAPRTPISLTWQRPELPVRPLLDDLRPRYLNPPFGLVDRRLVERAAEAGLGVATWTVDLRRTMRRMCELGVASVTTNRIDILRQELDRRGARGGK
ncbi:glycerophosphodiester phosphodiesterase [Kitasatospora sp. NPDC006697]|uniref:glycerophosphodiester phosphodiesterase n=1 Tax=Kitasatospora sp. NPDC006697 TaxID=3364020 RepID=UPI00368B9795